MLLDSPQTTHPKRQAFSFTAPNSQEKILHLQEALNDLMSAIIMP
jgi:hypothetical protein